MRASNFLSKIVLALGVALSGSAALAQQATDETQEKTLADYKAEAERLGHVLQRQGTSGGQFDAQGNPIKSESGVYESGQQGGVAEGQSEYFRGATGVESARPEGKVTQASVGARLKGKGSVDLRCPASGGPSAGSVSGVELRLHGCERAENGQITEVSVSWCGKARDATLCRPQDYSPVNEYTDGKYSETDAGRLGVGCNSTTGVCRLSLEYTVTVAENGEQMEAKAAAKNAAAGEASFSGALAKHQETLANPSKVATGGVDVKSEDLEGMELENLADCVQQQNTDREAGRPIRTCDGSGEATIDYGPLPEGVTGTCSTVVDCVRTATTTRRWSTVCDLQVPLTSANCRFRYPTAECTRVVLHTEDANGIITQTETTTCVGDKDEPDGGTVVRTLAEEPYGSVEEGNHPKDFQQKTYYYWPKEEKASGACTASPYPLLTKTIDSSCRTDKENTVTTCPGNDWFGRDENRSCTSYENDGTQVTHTFQSRSGCGVCKTPTFSYTCYAEEAPTNRDSCAGVELQHCRTTGADTPLQVTNGIVTRIRRTYDCSRSETRCIESKARETCSNQTMTHGFEGIRKNEAPGGEGFNEFVATMAIMDETSKGFEPQASATAPLKLFGGEELTCRKPRAFMAGLDLSNNCCKIDLQRPGGGRALHKCTEDEVRLAANRRGMFTYTEGWEYCSKSVRFGLIKTCVQLTERHCAFGGMLPRIVQVQGRAQLNKLVTGAMSSPEQDRQLLFNYYSSTSKGGWTTPVTVNGQTVMAWQEPAYCKSPEQYAAVFQNDPDAVECQPVLRQYFAVCDKPSCGATPGYPDDPAGGQWKFGFVDPLRSQFEALTSNAAVKGECNSETEACNYTVSGFPAGQATKKFVQRQMIFAGTFRDPEDPKGESTNSPTYIGDYVVRPRSRTSVEYDGKTAPTIIQVDLSTDGGETFEEHRLYDTDQDGEHILPIGDLRMRGRCDGRINMCSFTVTGTLEVKPKPWWDADARAPDCSGFTMAQVAALDFDKMDMSEFTQGVTAKLNQSAVNNANATAAAGAQAAAKMQDGQIGTMGDSKSPVAITPRQIHGPQIVHLRIGANFPVTFQKPEDNKEKVLGATVDWGDGSAVKTLTAAPQSSAYAFFDSYTYPAPNEIKRNPVEATVVHPVTVRMWTEREGQVGVRTHVLYVVNQFSSMAPHLVVADEHPSAWSATGMAVPTK